VLYTAGSNSVLEDELLERLLNQGTSARNYGIAAAFAHYFGIGPIS